MAFAIKLYQGDPVVHTFTLLLEDASRLTNWVGNNVDITELAIHTGAHRQSISGCMPNATSYGDPQRTWHTSANILQAGFDNMTTYTGQAHPSDIIASKLEDLESGQYYYIQKSGERRYVNFYNSGTSNCYVTVYDDDGTTVLFTQQISNFTNNGMQGHAIPPSIPKEMTLNQFVAASKEIGLQPYGYGQNDVIATWTASCTNDRGWTAWLYYILHNNNEDVEPDTPDNDPYSGDDGGYTPGEPDPGDGERDPYDPGDDLPVPDLPPFSLGNSAFTSLWIPSLVQLNLLATFMWSDNFVDTVVKKLYSNPIDVIISLGIVPFNVTPDGVANICVGDHDTGISSNYVDDDCVVIDCGSVAVKEMIPGGYLNYYPYTKATIFLPYVGFIEIETNEIMNSTISIEYHVCLTNGSFVAFVSNTDSNGTRVIAQYEGNMKVECSVSSADYSQMWNTIVGTLTAPLLGMAGGAAQSAIASHFAGASKVLTSEFAAQGGRGLSSAIGSEISNAGNKLNENLSPSIQKSGAFSPSSGAMGYRKPFIILKSPEIKQPSNYNQYRGYPLQAEVSLGNCTGYTEIAYIRLSLPSASGSEACEVERLLRDGVIFGDGQKPTVGNSGIYLCKNSSPANQINKSVTLVSSLSGDFRDSVNVMTPVVRIERSSPIGFNYLYIGEFERWYFVNKVEVVRTGILDLYLSEDVLESFSTEIKKNKAIISNNANAYNVYLNDNQLIHTQRDLYWRKEFPKGFYENDSYEWVLLIAGKRN